MLDAGAPKILREGNGPLTHNGRETLGKHHRNDGSDIAPRGHIA